MAERLKLEDDLRQALERDELELYYQPLVDLDERRIVAVEALVRWRHPRQGVVLPGEFMTVAEESGLIVPLGRWVLREACRQLARWTADPAIDLPCLTVNLSGRQLAEASLPDELAAILRQTGVPPERLGLELTESVLMQETSSPTAVLQDLKGLGVRLMLDDFGTGYSSLNHVKRFPIEAIKVDREFVNGVAEDEGDRHILRAIVSMASAMDVAVIAEGVETREQARWLRHLGIKLVQGYAFGRPAPAATIEALLRDGLPLDRLALAFEPIEGAPAAAPAPTRAAGRARRLPPAAPPSRSARPPWPAACPPAPCAAGPTPAASPSCARAAATAASPSPSCGASTARPPRAPPSAPSRCPPTRCPRSRDCSRAPPASSPPRSPAASMTALPTAGSAPSRAASSSATGARRSAPPRAAPTTTRRSTPPAGSSPRPTSPAPRCSSATPSSSATARPSCARCRSAAPRAPSSSAPAALFARLRQVTLEAADAPR